MQINSKKIPKYIWIDLWHIYSDVYMHPTDFADYYRLLLRNTLQSQVLTGQLTTRIVTKVQILNYFQSCVAKRFDILITSLNSHGLLRL